jgi:hypothetical protein
VGRRRLLAKVFHAAVGADFGHGVEENLDVGVWEDDGTDVAAFHHHAGAVGELALLLHERPPYTGDGRYFRGALCDLGGADGIGHVFAVQRNAERIGFESDVGGDGKLLHHQ